MKALVSIIVPVYNSGNYIKKCIDSILCQSFSQFELILVNDGSTDNSCLICEEYAKLDSRIKFIQKSNGGVSSARNAGIEEVDTEYIVFVDSDDVVGSNYLNELMKEKEFDFVTAGFHWEDNSYQWQSRKYDERDTTISQIKSYPSQYLGKYYFGSPWAKLFKSSIIKSNKLKFNETIHSGEDTYFIFDYLSHCNNVKILALCEYYYHYYSGSLAHKTHDDYWKWKIQVEEKMTNFFTCQTKEEILFLENRHFEVLQQLIEKYKNGSNTISVYSIFEDSFFKNCLKTIKENGSFSERVLIWCMEMKVYSLYVILNRFIWIVNRGINKIKREIKKWRK